MQLLRKIAFPFSLIYALVVYLRNLLYDKGIFKSYTFKTPTVCIGNLSVGGTGKTPMIEYLLELLQTDYKIAVLSRGYRRKTTGFLLANKDSKVAELGDEPFQIYTKYDSISVAVDADRRNGIKNLEKIVAPELILLDDAFQHRRVRPSVSILLTTYSNPYYRDCYLPTGGLRDNKQEASRANLIIITKCPEQLSKQEKQRITGLIKPKKHQKILFSRLVYSNYLTGINGKIPISTIKGKRFSLVTGIANPKPLVAYLKSNGYSFDHFRYSDHHFFNEGEIARFSKNDLVVTTAKDFTKLSGKCSHIFYLGVKHEFFGDGKLELTESIKRIMIGSGLYP